MHQWATNGPGRNAIGGGLVVGVVGGVISAFVFLLFAAGFRWSIIGKWIISAMMIGLAIEALCRLWRVKKR